MSITTIILDCDGVIVDSEKYSCGATNIVFRDYFQIEIGTDYHPVIGKSVKDAINYFLQKHSLEGKIPIEELADAKERAYRKAAKGKLHSIAGINEFIKKVREFGLKLGVASSGSIKKIKFSLKEVNLDADFDSITSSHEVEKGKPHPDVFLLSAKKMKANPAECIVIEDSITGAKAGLSAGMKVFGFPGTFFQKDFKEIGVEFLESGYSDLIKVISEYAN